MKDLKDLAGQLVVEGIKEVVERVEQMPPETVNLSAACFISLVEMFNTSDQMGVPIMYEELCEAVGNAYMTIAGVK